MRVSCCLLAELCLSKKPELSACQAGGILKYRRLALLDSNVFLLANNEKKTARTFVRAVNLAVLFLQRKNKLCPGG